MRSIVKSLVPLQARKEQQPNQPLTATVEPIQLDNIKTHLDLVLLSLEALVGLSSEEVLQAAIKLNLDTIITDRVTLWRLRQSNPLRQSQGGRKKLDVEEAQSLVFICCHLARNYQTLIRQAVISLEDLTAHNRQPHEIAILGDYLDAFCNFYQDRMEGGDTNSPAALTELALKLLVDLLFYSAPDGPRYFWLALLDESTTQVPSIAS